MSKKLAIKGHATRGDEVIELLEMMGGINKDNMFFGKDLSCIYFIDDYGFIRKVIIENNIHTMRHWQIFTLEEFLEKYPFKINDFVNIPEYESEVRICKMRWDPICQDVEYLVYHYWYTASALLEYNAEFLVNKEKGEETDKMLIDITLNHLYENGLKNTFKKHDIVVVESCDKQHKWICEYKSYVNNQLYFYKGTYDICSNEDAHKRKLIYDSFYDVMQSDIIRVPSSGEITLFERIADKCINNECINDANPITEYKTIGQGTYAIKIADGYKFDSIDENGNIIIKSIKSKYPTTYKECCEVLKIPNDERYIDIDVPLDYNKLLSIFTELLICRKAYYKIAGEEMRLGKPWEPDWNEETDKFTISNKCNKIYLNNTAWYAEVLSFPTAEMRDAFYENFKDLIESCKELL